MFEFTGPLTVVKAVFFEFAHCSVLKWTPDTYTVIFTILNRVYIGILVMFGAESSVEVSAINGC